MLLISFLILGSLLCFVITTEDANRDVSATPSSREKNAEQ
jgi:hypothetical protein